jgi:hypothetical protein
VNWIRGFSEQPAGASGARTLEDAPEPMRQELVDLFFSLAEHRPEEVPPEHVYNVTSQSLGIHASGNPYGGFRYASGRDVRKVEWPIFTDQQIEQAAKRLRSVLPVGMRPSDELIRQAAKQLEISDDLLALVLHGSKPVKVETRDLNTAELKKGLAALRPPVDPADRRKGW